MILRELLRDLADVQEATMVHGVTTDSRAAAPGLIFVAVRGQKHDGHHFVAEACAKGVAAVVVEDTSHVPKDFTGVLVLVPSTRWALQTLAARFYGDPAKHLQCVAVTGTNGKTSTTYLLEHLLNRGGRPCGVLGTIDHHLLGHTWPTTLTTPDPWILQQRLQQFVDHGAKALAMEVSSHALDQKRADSLVFDCAIFTNLTRDHLDYHASMEDYYRAKARLFRDLAKASVVNTDDTWGAQLAVQVRATTFGTGQQDFSFQIDRHSFAGLEMSVRTPSGDFAVRLPMTGLHNAYNAVGAVAACHVLGLDIGAALAALADFAGVPGRLERVMNTRGLHIFVDYAHTPDALEQVLSALKNVRASVHGSQQIVTVFGCGGDRDRGKRPLMLHAALAGSDQVILTSDNPRTEDPKQIAADCLKGLARAADRARLKIELDRRRAIVLALSQAQVGDVILVAGKGHEQTQQIGSEKHPFSDVKVIKEILT